jgi:hypothetical protein
MMGFKGFGRVAAGLAVVAGMVGDASGITNYPTVGTYGASTNNAIDYTASGSTVSLAEMRADVGAAFEANAGGVFQCEVLGGTSFKFALGSAQTKLLAFHRGAGTQEGISAPSPWALPVSGHTVWSNANNATAASLYTGAWILDGLTTGGAPGERIVEFGITVLSQNKSPGPTPIDYGTMSVTVGFSDGSSATAQRWIHEAPGEGDTFYGFRAPAGLAINTFTVSASAPNSGYNNIFFDDPAFVTSAYVPEPAAAGFLAVVAAAVYARTPVRARRR